MGLFETVTAISESKCWFLSLIEQWREARPRPVAITALPVEVPELWSKQTAALPRAASVALHLAMLAVALIPAAAPPKRIPKGFIDVALYLPRPLLLPAEDAPAGGGGGGRHQPAPPSLGRPPKAAGKQFVPPDPEPPKNPDPALIVEPSVIAPQLASLPHLNLLNIGDPDGVPGPPWAGSGNGYGIGPGDGHGDGPGNGPGVGPGEDGGFGRDVFHIGGSISSPVLVTQILPEYSEEARKARFQGTVVLDTIVLEDGTVQIVKIARRIGFGLEERAIAAVLQWRFRPARRNGKPVPVALNIEVNFNLR